MTGLSALGIKELIGCQLCKSGYKSIFYFGDKLNSPNWHSLKLSLSLSREFQVFCCHDGKRKKYNRKQWRGKNLPNKPLESWSMKAQKFHTYTIRMLCMHTYTYTLRWLIYRPIYVCMCVWHWRQWNKTCLWQLVIMYKVQTFLKKILSLFWKQNRVSVKGRRREIPPQRP